MYKLYWENCLKTEKKKQLNPLRIFCVPTTVQAKSHEEGRKDFHKSSTLPSQDSQFINCTKLSVVKNMAPQLAKITGPNSLKSAPPFS